MNRRVVVHSRVKYTDSRRGDVWFMAQTKHTAVLWSSMRYALTIFTGTQKKRGVFLHKAPCCCALPHMAAYEQ